MISYDVDDNGILRIYLGRRIAAEIWGCQDKTPEELEKLVNEIVEEMELN